MAPVPGNRLLLLPSRSFRIVFSAAAEVHLRASGCHALLENFVLCVGACCFLLSFQGCHSQPDTLTPQLTRNVELVVRAQVNVPANWTVTPEEPRPSSIPGYDAIDIRFGSEAGSDHQQTIPFLISKDREHLARLSNFTLRNVQGTHIRTDGLPVRGPQTAPIEIIDFDDMECPFCAQMDAKILPDVMTRYKGLVKVVYKAYPLIGIHPWAMHAAVNAKCLSDQSSDAYWNFVGVVHARSAEITGSTPNADASAHLLDTLAEEEGPTNKLNQAVLNVCVARQNQSSIEASIEEGKALGAC